MSSMMMVMNICVCTSFVLWEGGVKYGGRLAAAETRRRLREKTKKKQIEVKGEEDGKEEGGGGFIYKRGGACLVLLKLEGSLMICSPNLP